MYQIVIAAILGAVLGEVFGTSCQMSKDYSCGFTESDGSNSGSIHHCSTHPYTGAESNNIQWVDIISLENCDYSSHSLTTLTEHNQNVINNCHITTNTAQKLTLNFVTRVSLVISIEAGGIVCNILCNFNVWSYHNCSNYDALAFLTQDGLPVCHYRNYSVSINITFIDEMIYINNESQIINQCRENELEESITDNSRGNHVIITMPTLTTTNDNYKDTAITISTIFTSNNIDPAATSNLSTSSTMIMNSNNIASLFTTSTMTVDNNGIAGLSVGVVCSILVTGTLICILIAVLLIYIRKSARQKQSFEDQNNPYSLTQVRHDEENHQSQLQANANQYEQFHLSSSTEFIHTAESEAISSMSTQPELQADFHGIYLSIDTVQPQPVSQELEGDDPMYDVVGKGSDDKKQHEDSHDGPSIVSNYQDITKIKDTTSITEEGRPSTPLHVVNIHWAVQNDPKSNATVDDEETSPTSHNRVEELYTVVKKNPKGNKKEEAAPPLPLHTVEVFYTAIVKKPKTNAEDKEQNPPPDSVEELYTAVVKKPKGNVEDEDKAPPIPPYSVEEHTAVNRNSKDNQGNDSEEGAPPIPPHTVEELYTAVMEKSKDSVTKDGQEAPPIPPYTVDELSCNLDNDK